METKTTIKELPSGKIEIVNNGTQMFLQFNCSCEEALPFCKGMCCSYRPAFNAEVVAGDYKDMRFNPRIANYEHLPGKVFMDYRKHDGHCIEHTVDGLCYIHDYKPRACKISHCSPGGVGEGIKVRQGGWLLFPTAVQNKS